LAAHRQPRAKLVQGLAAVGAQPVEKFAARRVGESLEDLVHGSDNMQPNGCLSSAGELSVNRRQSMPFSEGQRMGETVVGEKGMVVAPHRAAAEAGAEILREGGNAVEAMIAAAATIAVVYPHMNSIGGDGFWLIAEPGRPPRAIDACGAAGAFATRERYEAKGYDRIPARGPDAALTVAGTVSGWTLALEAAASLGGRMPRGDLIADAIRRAREGSPVSRSEASALRDNLAEFSAFRPFAAQFLPGGKVPEVGANRTQP